MYTNGYFGSVATQMGIPFVYANPAATQGQREPFIKWKTETSRNLITPGVYTNGYFGSVATQMGIPFVYAPRVYWKMGAYQNVTSETEVVQIKSSEKTLNFHVSINP